MSVLNFKVSYTSGFHSSALSSAMKTPPGQGKLGE